MKIEQVGPSLMDQTISISNILPYIREMASDNDQIILIDLGFNVKINGDVQCACPIHGGDNKNGFSYKSAIKTWKCWTNRCHEKYGSDIFGLIQCLKQTNVIDTIEYVLSISENLEFIQSPEIKKLLKQNKQKDTIFFQEDSFAVNKMPPQILSNMGLNLDILDKFKAYHHNGRDWLPIFTDDQKIIGFTGRGMDVTPKWQNYPTNIYKSDTLYGIHLAKEKIKTTKTAILVEGPKDVIKLHQCGFTNAVSPMGLEICREQIKLLLKYNTETVIIAYDPDEAGIAGSNKLAKKLDLYFKIINITSKIPSDPGKMSVEELTQFFI